MYIKSYQDYLIHSANDQGGKVTTMNVIICDSYHDVCEMTASIIEEMQPTAKVHQTYSGEDMMSLLDTVVPDLVITHPIRDLELDVVLTYLRYRSPDVIIYLMSATEEKINDAIKYNCHGFLEKPFDYTQIEKILQGIRC